MYFYMVKESKRRLNTRLHGYVCVCCSPLDGMKCGKLRRVTDAQWQTSIVVCMCVCVPNTGCSMLKSNCIETAIFVNFLEIFWETHERMLCADGVFSLFSTQSGLWNSERHMRDEFIIIHTMIRLPVQCPAPFMARRQRNGWRKTEFGPAKKKIMISRV